MVAPSSPPPPPPAAAPPPCHLVAFHQPTTTSSSSNSHHVITVLGGKASCRRKFVIHVHLLDKHDNLLPHPPELSLLASVLYAHDHSPVLHDDNKPSLLAEPPLFTTFNGVEYPAQHRPSRMVAGRASFKLALSLLSSKCDNRLFCICFSPQAPFCDPCFSKPIRSISRKRTQVPSSISWKSLSSEETETASVFASPTCSTGTNERPVAARQGGSKQKNFTMRSSPTESRSILTSDSYQNSSTPGTPLNGPSAFNRPFRPYASYKIPPFDYSASISSPFRRHPDNLLERALQMRSTSSLSASVKQKLDAILQGFSMGACREEEFQTNLVDFSLEEEERSVQVLELCLQEIKRELETKKEELRTRKRRLMEDGARMNTICFQSSSWMESLSGRFGL